MTDDTLSQGGDSAPAPADVSRETPSTPSAPSARESIAAAFEKAGLGEQEGFTRDAQGRFAPKDQSASAGAPSASPGAPSAPIAHQNAPAAPQVAPTAHQNASDEPPTRFNAEAKAAWASAHPALKGEFQRAMGEMQKGLGMYQQALDPLKPYFQTAQQTGVPLHVALEQYVGFERALVSENPDQKMAAITELFRIAGLDPRQFASIVMGQEPQPRDQIVDQFGNTISQLQQQLNSVTKTIEQQQYEARLQKNMAGIDSFAQTHPRIDEPAISKYIKHLLETDMPGDLAGAYEAATTLIPSASPPAGQPSNGMAPAQTLQTRKGQLSTVGAPPGGSMPPQARSPATRRGSIASAFDKVGL